MEDGAKNGVWRRLVSDSVREICVHIQDGYKRENLFQEKYSLPRHFFLHELLTWLCHDLAAYSATSEDELVAIRKRQRYLEALENGDVIANRRVFVWETEVTMRMILAKVSGFLLYEVIPQMEYTLERRSSAERFGQLNSLISNHVLDGLLQFLFRVVRDDDPTEELVVSSFIDRPNAYTSYKKTKAGMLLSIVLSTSQISELYRYRETMHTPVPGLNEQLKENPFLTKDGKSVVPLQVAHQEDPGISVDAKAVTSVAGVASAASDPSLFLAVGKGHHTGVFSGLAKYPPVLQSFVALHALALELSSYLPYMMQAKRLADEGGDVLVYGVMHGRITDLLSCLLQLLSCIQDNVHTIRKVADSKMLNFCLFVCIVLCLCLCLF